MSLCPVRDFLLRGNLDILSKEFESWDWIELERWLDWYLQKSNSLLLSIEEY